MKISMNFGVILGLLFCTYCMIWGDTILKYIGAAGLIYLLPRQ